MNSRVLGIALCVGLSCGASSADGLKPHPRLLVDDARFAQVRESVRSSVVASKALAQVLEIADKHLADAKPVEYVLNGKRLDTAGALQEAVWPLAFAWRWTGERKYARAAVDLALYACREWPDFHPSHFLDLAIAGTGVAIVYDWCYGAMSDEERTLIAKALDERALRPALDRSAPWRGCFNRVSNWNQVCNGGVLMCAAAVREAYPEDAEAVRQQAVKGLPVALSVYAPDGCWPEGPGYWEFAMRYTAFAFEALEAGWGSTFGLDRLPGLDKAVGYTDAMTGPEGLMFNHGDNGMVRGPRLGVWYLASRYDRPEAIVNFEAEIFEKGFPLPTEKGYRVKSNGSGYLPLYLLYYRDVTRTERQLPLCLAMTNATMGIVSQRTAWKPGAWFAALRAGSNKAGHSHLDIGSFVLDAKGTRWAFDLGGEKYVNVELAQVDLWGKGQNSERWQLFRYSSEGHNTVTINGHPLKDGAYAPIVGFKPDFPSSAAIDLAPVLTDAETAQRISTLHEQGGWDLRDVIGGVMPGKKLEWRMNTDAQVKLDGDRAVLTKTVDGKPVTLEARIDGVKARWEVRDVSKPPHPCDSDNPGMRQLFFRTAFPKSGAVDYTIRFR